MKKSFKYRLSPTKSQRARLERTLDSCRSVYNEMLARRRDAWSERQESLSRYDTIRMLPQLKEERPDLNNVHSQVLQEVCTRVDLAFQGFFRRLKAKNGKAGYPRFKGKDRYDSFTYPQLGFKLTEDGKLYLSKIGDIKIRLHRPIEGTIKTLTIRRMATGKWYAFFSVEVEPKRLSPVAEVVGIDVGLEHFATLSTGEQIPNPRFFRQEEKALAKAQRKLSGAEKGTPERVKRRKVVARIHERIANKRRDFAHKLSRRLVNEFQVIAFERLEIQEMQNGNWHSINKSIGDAAWHQLRQFTSSKAEEAGRSVAEVEPRGTTQRCSRCGAWVPKDLSVRVHECPNCGLRLDRDHNAALNILSLGLQRLGCKALEAPGFIRGE